MKNHYASLIVQALEQGGVLVSFDKSPDTIKTLHILCRGAERGVTLIQQQGETQWILKSQNLILQPLEECC